MAIPDATHQAGSNAIAALGAKISLHTGAAGTNGANEASGGGYGRQTTTWTPGSTGVNTGSAVNIPCAAGTYVEGGIWSLASGGTFVGSAAFTNGDVIVSGTGATVTVTPTITV